MFGLLLSTWACGGLIGREYEYEEEVSLATDGSATVTVNSSIAALVALRGFDLDDSPTAEVDRDAIRRLFASPVTTVTRVSRPWRRNGRNYVQVRVETDDVRQLAATRAFGWSSYAFAPDGTTTEAGQPLIAYRQVMGPASVAEARPANETWTGDEIVAVRLHLPSRISFHNAPSKTVDRGNIIAWEQPLRDRIAGRPLDVHIRMETDSILARTLTILAMSIVAALSVLGGAVWWVARKGRPDPQRAGVKALRP